MVSDTIWIFLSSMLLWLLSALVFSHFPHTHTWHSPSCSLSFFFSFFLLPPFLLFHSSFFLLPSSGHFTIKKMQTLLILSAAASSGKKKVEYIIHREDIWFNFISPVGLFAWTLSLVPISVLMIYPCSCSDLLQPQSPWGGHFLKIVLTRLNH